MSDVDSVCLAVPESPAEVAAWVVDDIGAEMLAAEGNIVRLRVRGVTVDDWLGLVVQPNGFVEVDPEPGEAQAVDAYGIEVQVRGGGVALRAEADLIFQKLVDRRPTVPMLLLTNLDTLVAAHLPAAGTHFFEGSISQDEPDLDKWRPWVVARSDGR
ncbi:hypothetical protein E1263_14540 [Kribbella antibiotica]|uniref:Uncharacterized protein n=1 Tax=Kribbella antibiotica TaxID=190195 RepID=A0A4R4ZNM8_9ACTN|nr:hypothetical protein [Kribbella antibiotica]TDD59564.1 hypothetical protein E1263_14540 [Kribbella antibiotica]